jgi:hypothetical protein
VRRNNEAIWTTRKFPDMEMGDGFEIAFQDLWARSWAGTA